MNDDIYGLSDDKTGICCNDMELSLSDVVAELNNNKSKIENLRRELEVKETLCNAYEKKYSEVKKANRMHRAKILELMNEVKDYESKEDSIDINYWKGIEKAYENLIEKYQSKVIDLEKKNFYLLLELENIKNDILE